MDNLVLEIDNGQTAFAPGETVGGEAGWNLPASPKEVSLQLLWYTEGKGDEDAGLVEEVTFDLPQPSENRRFTFRIPEGPYSFRGKLISLAWAIELQVDREVVRRELVVSPTGEPIVLHAPQEFPHLD
ncbi:MAG TPA: hypothetical protein DD670_11315 [Planctomycetaceae bacterium]|nr:hypothetical protein [Planctomycetaceae bacterium]